MIIIASLSGAFVAIYLLVILMFGSSVFPDGLGHAPQNITFIESNTFFNLFHMSSNAAFNNARLLQRFETNGELDLSKVINIFEWDYRFSNIENNGTIDIPLRYSLENLVRWDQQGRPSEMIVVMRTPEGRNVYVTPQEFIDEIQRDQLQWDGWSNVDAIEIDKAQWENGLTETIQNITLTQFLSDMRDGFYQWDGSNTPVLNIIRDSNNVVRYTNFWTLNLPSPLMNPQGNQTLLELANQENVLNQNLSLLSSDLFGFMDEFMWSYSDYLDLVDSRWQDQLESNFQYAFVDLDQQVIISNVPEWQNITTLVGELNRISTEEDTSYIIARMDRGEFSSDTNIVRRGNSNFDPTLFANVPALNNGIFIARIHHDFLYQDVFQAAARDYANFVPFMYHYFYLTIFLFAVMILMIILLGIGAGRKSIKHTDLLSLEEMDIETNKVHLTWFDRIWGEVAIVLTVGVWMFLTYLTVVLYQSNRITFDRNNHRMWIFYESLSNAQLIVVAVFGLLTVLLFLLILLSMIRRIKAKTWWKNSVSYRFGKTILRMSLLCLKWLFDRVLDVGRRMKRIWFNRKITLRATLLILIFVFIHWVGIASRLPLLLFVVFVIDVLALMFVYANAIAKNRIKTGIKEIASGNIEYQISLKGLYGENLVIAELVNSVGHGLNQAVDNSLRSERMKTDLITNVSHDIKTPLTSIINYIDLLKRENLTDPKILNYLDILDVKSQQLKNLTEDVVEASKVSSGNVTLEMMNMNLIELIHQVEGEFEDRFEEKKLTYISHIPYDNALIHVDGKRMWRILENVFINIYKYAMPGTRVYAELIQTGQSIEFSLKNVSEKPLNISPEELTERFIRGDVARSTEGSGLGLSIAKSLTELMQGTLELSIDGDLFKVLIRFLEAEKDT